MTQPHAHLLSILAAAPPKAVKALANAVLPQLLQRGPLDVVHNRTGLVMLPYRDTVRGTPFHLGEALVAEGHVRQGDLTGYGACLGRDLEQALSLALLDLAHQSGVARTEVQAFVSEHAAQQAERDNLLRRKVESTRVQMETF